jgi:hypothetical protein
MSSIWWFGGGGGGEWEIQRGGKEEIIIERNRAAALVFFVIWKDPVAVTMTAVHKSTLQQVGTIAEVGIKQKQPFLFFTKCEITSKCNNFGEKFGNICLKIHEMLSRIFSFNPTRTWTASNFITVLSLPSTPLAN